MSSSERTLVLALGSRPLEVAEFANRSLTVRPTSLDELDDELMSKARGVVLCEFPGKRRITAEYLAGPLRRACELGLVTISHISTQHEGDYFVSLRHVAPAARSEISRLRLGVLTGTGDELHKIAERIARHSPGPRLGSLNIERIDSKDLLDAQTECLLRRAFSDSGKIVVESLPGGKTAKETFRVFASLPGPTHGPQPMPFFVKVAPHAAIEKERKHYQLFAEPFIPFHLRPALNDTRCVTGLESSALVCNFVESAIPLRSAWRSRQGSGTLFSLFEVTLRGLRSHLALTPRQAGVLERFLEKRVRAHEIRTSQLGMERIQQAKQLGLQHEPEDLQASLVRRAHAVETRTGTIHGDLHFGNVMVRNRDAIVIDFGSMDDFGPSTADPSVLEVSMVFGTDERDDAFDFSEWKSFVDEVFINSPAIRPPVPDSEHMKFAWLRQAIREIRHVTACCGVTETESLIVLAGCLLRFARLSPFELPSERLVALSETRRCYALVIAEAICAELTRRAQS